MLKVAEKLREGNEVADADWISVGDLARLHGVTHQAISKRIRSLSRRGNLPMRRLGKHKLIHAPSFDAIAAATYDPAQALRNRNTQTRVDDFEAQGVNVADNLSPTSPMDTPRESLRFNDAATREKHAKAELAEMQLAQKRGELVPVREIEAAAIEASTRIAQRLNAMKALAGRLYAAAKGGEEALAALLQTEVTNLLRAVAEDMAKLAADDGKPKEDRPN